MLNPRALTIPCSKAWLKPLPGYLGDNPVGRFAIRSLPCTIAKSYGAQRRCVAAGFICDWLDILTEPADRRAKAGREVRPLSARDRLHCGRRKRLQVFKRRRTQKPLLVRRQNL